MRGRAPHTSKLGLITYSAGGYWIHYGPTGWYLDVVLQGNWYGRRCLDPMHSPLTGRAEKSLRRRRGMPRGG